MLGTVQAVLIDPDGFFEDRVSEPRLLPPVLIMIAYIVLRGATDFPVVLLFDAELQLILLFGSIGLLLGNGFVGIFAWLLYAVVFYGLSYLFGGSGSFRRMFTLIGWGFLPLIAAKFVLLIATSVAVQGAPSIPLGASEQLVAVRSQIRSGPAFVVVSLITMAMNVWAAYIWTFSLKHARDLSARQALLTVGIPVALVLLVLFLISVS